MSTQPEWLTGLPIGHLISIFADLHNDRPIKDADRMAMEAWRDEYRKRREEADRPIPALLFCPYCKAQHIDLDEWSTRPHHTHLCASCKKTWRVEPYCTGAIGTVVSEEHRQALLLALAELSLNRPGWYEMLGEMAAKFYGREMFESFRETSAPAHPPHWTCVACASSGPFETITHDTPGEPVDHDMLCSCGSTDIRESPVEAFDAHVSKCQSGEYIEKLLAAIRKHRDEKGDDRCWLDDVELYRALPEGAVEVDLRLHEPEAMLANCRRFIANRHDPSVPYVSPQRRIEELEAEVKRHTTPTDEFDGELVVRDGVTDVVRARVRTRVKQLQPGHVEFLHVEARHTLGEDWTPWSAIYFQLPNGFSIHLWSVGPLKQGDTIGWDKSE